MFYVNIFGYSPYLDLVALYIVDISPEVNAISYIDVCDILPLQKKLELKLVTLPIDKALVLSPVAKVPILLPATKNSPSL